ncbi:MAG: DUF262 domain-containing protein [Alphaproteobacteria bacterium]
MSINLTASISTVGELFSDTKVFRIPEFQRPYSWDEEKALQLFEDLQIAYVDRERVNSGKYFLGTLIIKKDGQFNNCIVDGQQRLVTLTVILAVIRDLYDANYRADLQNILIRQASQTLRLDKSPRVHLRQADNECFFKWVITEGGTLRLTDEAPTLSTAKLLSVLKCLRTEVAKTYGNFWKGLATFILNECNLVIISTDALEMSYKLFKSVNNVGVPLDLMAIARAELLGREVNNQQICLEISKAWDEIEVNLGTDSLQGYIMTVARLVNPECVKEEPFEAIRSIAKSPQLSAEFNVKLREFLLAYSALDNATIDFGPDSPQINRLVACILNTPFDDWRTAALYWLTVFVSVKASLGSLLKPNAPNALKLSCKLLRREPS